MPKTTIYLLDAENEQPVTDQGQLVTVSQDKVAEGFKELFRTRPHPTKGTVEFEASTYTTYRINVDGSKYHEEEELLHTGFNFWMPIEVTVYLKRKFIPTPSIGFDWGHMTRDVGLGNMLPFVIGLVAVAVIVAVVAYGASKTGLFSAIKQGGKKAAEGAKAVGEKITEKKEGE